MDRTQNPAITMIGYSFIHPESPIVDAVFTTKEHFDEYNNSFGTFTEISFDSDHIYHSIEEAYEAYMAQ